MRAAKILAGILIGLVVVIAVALLAVRFLVNPNDYKPRIAAAVKQSTGRDLVLAGDIKLSVFPWIALELGPASLGNPPNFDHEPFLAFQHAAVRVKLLPLLHRELEVGRIELDGLDVRLRRNAEGKGNWEMSGEAKETPEKPVTKGGYGESLKNIAGIQVTHGRISYQDIVVDQIEFETGAFGDHGVIPIVLSLNANYGGPDKTATLNAKFSLSVDEEAEQVRFAAVSLSGLASHPGSNRPGHWELSAPAIDANLKAQTLAIPSFALSFLGAQINGKLSATHIIDDPAATGSFRLDPLSLREFLPRLGIALPHVHDERALAQLAISSELDYGPKGVRLDKIQVTLDDTHLHGNIALLNEGAGDARASHTASDGAGSASAGGGLGAAKAETAPGAGAKAVSSAAAQAMKAARAGEGAGGAASKALSAAVDEGTKAADAHERNAGGAKALKFDLGVDGIDLNRYLVDATGAPEPKKPAAADGKPEKPMDADGILTIGNVHFSTYDFTSVRATLASHDGVIRLAPTQALIDGGRYAGDITLDERGPVAQIAMDEHLTGVDMAKLMSQGALKGRVSGHGNVNIKATAKGMDADSVFKTLNGNFDANLTEGALEGIDLGYALAQAESLISHQTLATAQNAGRTKFDAFKMSAQIANGIATTKDINIASPVLKVSGQGNINLPTKAVDLSLLAALLKGPKSTAVEIPVKVTGTYLDPTVRPDVEALAKGALKQKLQDTLGDKLKQFLGKP